MREFTFTFNFKGGPITVTAFNYEQAETLAKAEAIKRGWDSKIIDKKSEQPKPNPIVSTPLDNALMFICELTDTDTLDEQLDCIEALKKLRNKLKDKENTK